MLICHVIYASIIITVFNLLIPIFIPPLSIFCPIGLLKLNTEIDKLSSEVVTCRNDYEDAKSQLQSKQNELNACNKEIKVLEGLKEKCVKAAQTAALEGRKITHKLKQWEAESKGMICTVVNTDINITHL